MKVTCCQRRRLQNRVAQRAFRQRNEERLQVLEASLADWKTKHEKLSKVYHEQSGKLERMKAEVAQLLREVEELRRGLYAQDQDEWYFEQWQRASWDEHFEESWHLDGDDKCATFSEGVAGANDKTKHGGRPLDAGDTINKDPGDQLLWPGQTAGL
jgi:uncharacterized coiled-coil protein SlyX